MNFLSKDILIKRAQFLHFVRNFFSLHDFWELDTPQYLTEPGQEPYLEPFQLFSHFSKEQGFLSTSPEYSLKQALSMGLDNIFEIAHCFRSGEGNSNIHTAEFLMLEFYEKGKTEWQLMDTCISFLEYLDENFHSFLTGPIEKMPVEEVFQRYISCGLEHAQLQTFVHQNIQKNTESLRYEDLFFLIFLNFIENRLPEGPIFLYDYPPQMAALAKIVDGRAKRFEIYWKQIELANAFYELTDKNEQVARFSDEQEIRRQNNRPVYPMNQDFLRTLEVGIPDSAGIAIGLDRLLMLILGYDSLQKISPYYKTQL